jgi:hypothetical protein
MKGGYNVRIRYNILAILLYIFLSLLAYGGFIFVLTYLFKISYLDALHLCIGVGIIKAITDKK